MFKNLLAIGITLGLNDRDAFVKKVSGLIEDYQQNPEQAEEWAGNLAKWLETLKDDIKLQQNIKTGVAEGMPKAEIEKLTAAIQQLTTQMQQQKKD
ncbi:MAG: hypothetical protein KA149_01405 [Chitinophagales bacterium]|nr:hypothetical protein [Chitinophagales bacterium]